MEHIDIKVKSDKKKNQSKVISYHCLEKKCNERYEEELDKLTCPVYIMIFVIILAIVYALAIILR